MMHAVFQAVSVASPRILAMQSCHPLAGPAESAPTIAPTSAQAESTPTSAHTTAPAESAPPNPQAKRGNASNLVSSCIKRLCLQRGCSHLPSQDPGQDPQALVRQVPAQARIYKPYRRAGGDHAQTHAKANHIGQPLQKLQCRCGEQGEAIFHAIQTRCTFSMSG